MQWNFTNRKSKLDSAEFWEICIKSLILGNNVLFVQTWNLASQNLAEGMFDFRFVGPFVFSLSSPSIKS